MLQEAALRREAERKHFEEEVYASRTMVVLGSDYVTTTDGLTWHRYELEVHNDEWFSIDVVDVKTAMRWWAEYNQVAGTLFLGESSGFLGLGRTEMGPVAHRQMMHSNPIKKLYLRAVAPYGFRVQLYVRAAS